MENMENTKKINKNITGIGILVIVICVFVGLVFFYNQKEELVNTHEAEKLELFSAAFSKNLEEARGMEYEAAQDYIINSLYDNQKAYGGVNGVDYLSNQLLMTTKTSPNNTNDLVNNLSSALESFDLTSLLGDLLGSDSGDTATKTITMASNTVCEDQKIDNKYCVEKLSANVYIADANSDKWAVIVHPFMTSGSLMYNTVGSMYTTQGYNVVAPDLRGFGNSDGSVAMGYLESLDIYDWIKDLNSNWKNKDRYGVNTAPKTIVVHGMSLGGATTLQLATNPDIAAASGGPYTQNLTQLNVKGFVDDCGYTSMSGIITDMLSFGGSFDISNLLSSLGIDKLDFMSELQKTAEKFNIGGIKDIDISGFVNGTDANYSKYFEQFNDAFEKVTEDLQKYENSNGQYQIPNVDMDSIKDLVEGFFPTSNNSDAKVRLMSNNTKVDSANVLDGLVGTVLMNLIGVGLTEDNYAEYSNAFAPGRSFPAGSKVLIIHGTADTTVPNSNAQTVANNVKPGTLLHKWDAEGMPHAFVLLGSGKDEYTNLIANFTKCVPQSNCTSITK